MIPTEPLDNRPRFALVSTLSLSTKSLVSLSFKPVVSGLGSKRLFNHGNGTLGLLETA